MTFDCIQTFFVDPEAVNNSAEIILTSIELFFKEKPTSSKNSSGMLYPGVTISICDVANDSPLTESIYSKSYSTVPYSQIFAFSDASVPTSFRFLTPIPLKTGKFYGIVIKLDDSGYKLWSSKQGERIIGTNTPSSGSGNIKDGKYYFATNTTGFKAQSDTDLKYRVNIARFTGNNVSIDIVNKDYEFLTVNNVIGTFMGGEYVYQKTANASGNIAYSAGNNLVIGTGTDFTQLQVESFVVSTSPAKEIMQIDSVINSTAMLLLSPPATSNSNAKFMVTPVGKVYFTDTVRNKLYLVGSSANSTVKYINSSGIVGSISNASANIVSVDILPVDRFIPQYDISAPTSGSIDVKYAISYSNGSQYIVDSNNTSQVSMGVVNDVKKYLSAIHSKSLEVSLPYLYGDNRKSALTKVSISINTPGPLFTTPYINGDVVDFYIQQNRISNTYISGGFDSEVFKNGIAQSKHITKKITFANNHYAEDVRVYMNAYVPANTSIRPYVKLHNSSDPETFDDKNWTPLTYIENANKQSSSEKSNDVIEYTLGLPQSPVSDSTLAGTFTTQLGNNVIVASGADPSPYAPVGTLIKIYNRLIPENRLVAVVTSSNTSSITISRAVGDNNVVGPGYSVDVLKYKYTGFNNIQNDNVARYYNTSLVEFDKFDSMQFKFVLLSDKSNITPYIESIQCIGLSA